LIGASDEPSAGTRPVERALSMFSLVLAGEAIFGLPFHVSRYFRPTFVDVFGITQTQLGIVGSVYGFLAMASYILGGGLADRFSVRALLVFSLSITGVSGLYLATIPSFAGLCGLFAFWGFSTILPFWSALIKATREWGGERQQGAAFGLLDGGRGLLAAVLAVVALYLFSQWLPDGGDSATPELRRRALQSTIFLYTVACLLAAIFVWWFIPGSSGSKHEPRKTERGHLAEVVKMPTIWLQAVIIVAAYCTYKGVDFYSQYAKDVWQWSEVSSARLSAWSTWMRPLAALAAGLVADRLSASRVVIGAFLLTGTAYVSFMLLVPTRPLIWLLWATVLVSCIGLFALRGIYFALLEASDTPLRVTGTAVGVISFVGYTPEIFMPLLGGWLIDRWGGAVTGYNWLFAFLCTMSFVGIAAALLLRRLNGPATRHDLD